MADHNALTARVRCEYEFGLADLLYEWNQLDEAHKHARIGLEYRQKLGGYLVVGDLVLARILSARGEGRAAHDALQAAEGFMQTYPFQLSIAIEFRATRIVQSLAAGDIQMASYFAESCTGGSDLEQTALAQLLLAQGRIDEALRLLGQQRPLAEDGERIGRLIRILALQALALAARHRQSEAVDTLTRALALAQPSGYVRVFLDLGKPLRDLLSHCATQGHPPPPVSPAPPVPGQYADRLLAAFEQERITQGDWLGEATSVAAPPDVATADALTARELEVLQLLAGGLTNRAIAEQLVVAPSTIKQHLKSIYSKLDVHSRTQAVARGREFGYL
jgi:LuxR family maltose regulon positive regulatory protein